MPTIKDYDENLKRIEHEIEQNKKSKLGLKEKILDIQDDIQDLKEEGADRKEIRKIRISLDKFHKQLDANSQNYYWLRSQKKTCELSISHLKKQEGI